MVQEEKIGVPERSRACWAGQWRFINRLTGFGPQSADGVQIFADSGGVDLTVFLENGGAGELLVDLDNEVFGADSHPVGEVADTTQHQLAGWGLEMTACGFLVQPVADGSASVVDRTALF